VSNTRQHKIFYGWWVLLAAFLLQVLLATFILQSFGAFLAVMKDEFSWTKTNISTAFAIQQITGGIIGPFVGWLMFRYGSSRVIRAGLVIFALSLFLLSRTSGLGMFYLVVVVIAMGSSTAGFLPLNTLVVQWFEKRRAMVLALMQTALNVGGFLMPIVAWSLAHNGWRFSAVTYAGIVLAFGLPISLLIRDKPEDIGLLPDGGEPASAKTSNGSGVEITAEKALRTRAFWFIAFGHATALTIVFGLMVHLVLYLTEDLGFSLEKAGTVFVLLTGFSIAGQFLGGYFGDRLNKRLIASLAMFGHAIGLLILVYAKNYYWIIAFSLFHGLAWGFRGPIMQALRAEYFGRKSFGQIMGFSTPILTLGIITGPLIAGFLADKFGNYQNGFLILAGMAALGSLFFVFATRPLPRED